MKERDDASLRWLGEFLCVSLYFPGNLREPYVRLITSKKI